MPIIEVESENIPTLKTFKHVEWAEADKEHYGVVPPGFFAEYKHTLTMQENGEIVGYITFSACGGIGNINSILVGKNQRRRGIASKLLSAAEDKLKAYNVHKVMLETGADWKARHVYEKQGYTVRAILPNHVFHKESVLMDKQI